MISSKLALFSIGDVMTGISGFGFCSNQGREGSGVSSEFSTAGAVSLSLGSLFFQSSYVWTSRGPTRLANESNPDNREYFEK